MLLPVIMAGGTGSRLWPMSHELYPKQFLTLHGDHSMLQETVLRLEGLETYQPLVICNEEHRFLVAEQLRQIDNLSRNIILEPVRRNTAPAITLAALNAIVDNGDPLLLVLAADHIIENEKAFHRAILQALPYACSGNLVTFGIIPSAPETGYGYIQRGQGQNDDDIFQVHRFVEKPDRETAELYITSGEYYWNSGMFMFRAKKYLSELGKFCPCILSACEKAIECPQDSNQEFIRIDKNEFIACPNDSIDYAVMEKTTDAMMVLLDAGWSDVGSWTALWEANQKDDKQNVIKGDVFLHNTTKCYINTDKKMVAAIGVNNLVIVNTKDAVLVVDKDKVQEVKKVVQYLQNHRSKYCCHQASYCPEDVMTR